MDVNHEKQRVLAFVEKQNFHAAINIALSAMNSCRREQSQQGVSEFLDLIEDIVSTMRSLYEA